jgi:hypothetical protein
MQYLLDFVHEHTLEEQLYLVVSAPQGELELTWRRRVGQDDVWQVKRRDGEEAPAHVHYGDLIDYLETSGADMGAMGRELHALVMTQIAFADAVLRDATQLLGYEAVQQVVAGHRSFAVQLKAAVERITGPARRFELVPGGAAETTAGTGNLTLVR